MCVRLASHTSNLVIVAGVYVLAETEVGDLHQVRLGQQAIAGRQISVYEPQRGQVGHTAGDLCGDIDEGVLRMVGGWKVKYMGCMGGTFSPRDRCWCWCRCRCWCRKSCIDYRVIM